MDDLQSKLLKFYDDRVKYGPDTDKLLKIYDNYTRDNNGILQITDINIHSLPPLPENLIELWCFSNQLDSLPPLPKSLINLYCYENHLTSLPPLPENLQVLVCEKNQLTSLPPLPKNLITLSCSTNQLTSLPPLPESLTNLNCFDNQLTSLPPLPENLTIVFCFTNQLTSLPPLPKSITMFHCNDNQLTSLPPLPAGLEEFHCGENQLTSLPQLPDDVREFSCYGSPNLTTITGLCPIGIMNVYAKEAFDDCPSLKIQPNDDETCDNFFQRFYHSQTAPKVKIPKGQTDAITMNEIQDGEIMVDFQGEKERNRYYTAQTFKKLRNKNPFTRENIVGHVYYIAELDPSLPVQEAGRRRRKTFRKNRKNKGTRKYRPKRI